MQGSDGKQRDSWGITAIRITDLAVTPDFTRLVAVCESAASPHPNSMTPPARGESATPPTVGARVVQAVPPVAPSAEHHMIVYDLATKQEEV